VIFFLAPLGLAALLIAPLIYVIHLLRGSRRRIVVPAVFLWANLPRASGGRTQRRRPPITLLLLLQLLAAVLGALALARLASPSDPPRHVALVLDASASMQATDVSPSRFEAARSRGLDRLAGLRTTDRVSLIRAGTTASLLGSGTPESLRSTLAGAQVGNGTAAIGDALALASAQIAATPERRGQIVVLTDAAWPTPPPSGGLLAAPVEVVAVGGGSDNQAITSLIVRMDPSGRSQTAFVEIENAADHAVRIPVRLSGDGAPLDERQVDLSPRSRTRVVIPLPIEVAKVRVELLGHDALALDDVAETLSAGGPPRDIVLAGRQSADLRRALEAMPFAQVHLAGGATDTPAADLTVLEGVLPAQLPAGPLLLVDPPSSSGRLLGVGLGSGARVQSSHPLLQGLDLTALQAETPSVGGVPGWAKVVLGTTQGPLIMEGRLEGHPVVALTFDPALSGLAKTLAFPLLVSNASTYLLGQAQTPVASSSSNVEPFDHAESDIGPRPLPSFEPTASSPTSSTSSLSAGWLDRWPWLVGGVLLVLGLEWVVFTRRG